MILAGMVNLDEDALICDFAQTYHILSWRSLPLRLAATLAVGLEDNSRIKRKMSGEPASREVILLAHTVDRLTALLCGLSGKTDTYDSVVEKLYEGHAEPREKENEIRSFASASDFEEAMKKIKGRMA